MAVIFATLAVIYSQLLPPISGLDPTAVKVFVTLLSGAIGFLVFPDLATRATTMTISLFNFVISRISTEVSSQIIRLPREPFHLPFTSQSANLGVSLSRPLILDTSAIIDGRILDIAKTGFLTGTILLPTFVVVELQQVADSSDFLKRGRGRRGFEVIENLKKIKGLRIEMWDKEVAQKSVDMKLVTLAKNLHGKILTCDFNLNKVASIANIAVLNINDLANAVKTVALPGERLKLKIIHLGKDSKQGVGYLPDGTMIVVENGAEDVGQEMSIEVTKMLQIPAGRMIFAKKV